MEYADEYDRTLGRMVPIINTYLERLGATEQWSAELEHTGGGIMCTVLYCQDPSELMVYIGFADENAGWDVSWDGIGGLHDGLTEINPDLPEVEFERQVIGMVDDIMSHLEDNTPDPREENMDHLRAAADRGFIELPTEYTWGELTTALEQYNGVPVRGILSVSSLSVSYLV